jgi:hypothetical protein
VLGKREKELQKGKNEEDSENSVELFLLVPFDHERSLFYCLKVYRVPNQLKYRIVAEESSGRNCR